MRAILMAAGVGSRMGGSIAQPKSTLNVGYTTIIAHTVDMLTANGIDVSIVVGYRKEMIYEALSGRKVRFFLNPFYRATNSSASLWFARELIDGSDDVIFINADIYWEQPILDILLSDGNDAVMLGDASRADNGDFFLNTVNGRVTAYGKELRREERNTESVGIAKVSKAFSLTFRKWLDAHIEDERYGTLWEGIFCSNSVGTPIHVADVGGRFQAEVDTADDYERVKEYVSKGQRKDII